jgi:hypothetical protein
MTKESFMSEEVKTNVNEEVPPTVTVRDPGAWLILSIVTLGIMYIVWLLKLTRDIRRLEGHETTSYVEFILAVIVPVYGIYYIYKLAKRVESLSSQTGIRLIDDLAVSALLMSVIPLGGLIAVTIIQATINKMVSTREPA